MRALLLLTTLLMGTAAHADRVFVGAITPGANADPAIVAVLDEKLLASLRRQRQHEIVGARDVQAMMDVEAARQNSGCESGLSCEAELAGALDAPIIVTGQVGQVGNTWVLSLTRLDRTSMTVLARTTREVSGSPEGLLGTMDGQVDELFDVGVDVVPTRPASALASASSASALPSASASGRGPSLTMPPPGSKPPTPTTAPAERPFDKRPPASATASTSAPSPWAPWAPPPSSSAPVSLSSTPSEMPHERARHSSLDPLRRCRCRRDRELSAELR